MKSKFIFFPALVFLVGCSYTGPRYSASEDNVAALGSLNVERISVGSFTSFKPGLKELPCGGGSISTPDGKLFSEFIREALITDLQAAKVYETVALVTLTGHLDEIGLSSGEWNLGLTVISSNGRSVSVTENYMVHPVSESSCGQAARAVMPAIQALLGKAIANPEFVNMVR